MTEQGVLQQRGSAIQVMLSLGAIRYFICDDITRSAAGVCQKVGELADYSKRESATFQALPMRLFPESPLVFSRLQVAAEPHPRCRPTPPYESAAISAFTFGTPRPLTKSYPDLA